MCRSSAEGCRGRARPRVGPGGWRLIGGLSWDCNSPGAERRPPFRRRCTRKCRATSQAPHLSSSRPGAPVSSRPPPSRWHSRSFFWDGACTRGLARVSQGRGSFRGGRPCSVGSLCWFPFFSLPPSWRRARLNPSTRRRLSSRPLHRSNTPSLWRRRRNRPPRHSNTPSRPHRRRSKPLRRNRPTPRPRRPRRSKPLHHRQLRLWPSRPPPMRLQLRHQPPRQRRSMPRRQPLFLSSRLPRPRALLRRKLHRLTCPRLRFQSNRPRQHQLRPPLRWRLLLVRPPLPPLPTS